VPTPLPSSLNVKECSSASLTAPSGSKEMLKAMQKVSTSTKRTVPESDNFVKRRKKDDDLFMRAMTKQSTAVHRTQYARSTQAAVIYRTINEFQLQSVTYLSW